MIRRLSSWLSTMLACGAAVAVVLLVGCRADSSLVVDLVEFDRDSTMTVYAPSSGFELPVAVLLHGGSEQGVAQVQDFARELSRRDVVTFVPEWPAVTDLVAFGEAPVAALVDQTVAVVCALREARALASGYGGDTQRLMLIAASQSGAVALRVALAEGDEWPEASCRPTTDHRPTAVVGLGGNYDGHQYRSLVASQAWERFEPLRHVGREPAAEFLLVHGLDDTNVVPQESEGIQRTLRAEGHQSLLIELPGEHANLTRPTTTAGTHTLDLIEQLVFEDLAGLSVAAVIDLEYRDQQCRATTSTTVTPGVPFEVRLANLASEDAWMMVFLNEPDATVQPDLDASAGQRFESHPPFLDTVALRVVAPSGSNDAVVIVDEPDRWFVACAVPEGTTGVRIFTVAQLQSSEL